ncbi:hypothetical protein Cni_G23205 [Canna indica]|uniref:HSF-type DNA-binding domain-containing protein n=1 Tax=Canna indica TaxID=4628 RepID=A0AAQ3KTI9_9LILI|nr:hypothetical protein Cni_G23205 [Canna indica]
MDCGAPGAGGGGGGGPAPFLLKTYEMVDDASTDEIVSWSSTNASFVVWNPPEFAARLLPTYFKHNNFSSFIRQLNTYGFKKIDSERWEFANEEFVKGQKHLLKNIHRRKPIHSHSHPPGGGLTDPERTALEEEIERLNREKSSLETNLFRFKHQQSGTEIQLKDLECRLVDMEQRQLRMIAFVKRAMQNPRLMETLMKMASTSSAHISVIHKRRRLPSDADNCYDASENSFCDDHSSTNKPETGYILDRDFCDKLKLELCSAIADDDLVVVTAKSSNENGISQTSRTECDPELTECLSLAPETLQLCVTAPAICPTKNDLFARAIDEGEGLFPCHLSLTLASSAMHIDSDKYSRKTPDIVDLEPDNNIGLRIANASDIRTSNAARDSNINNIPVASDRSMTNESSDAKAVSLQKTGPTGNEVPSVPTSGVNDVFWQQFLTERPGSTEAEEANSSYMVNAFDKQTEDRMSGNDNIGGNKKDMEQLKL